MNELEVMEIVRQSIFVMMKVGGPIILVALFVGLAISIVQALTQIQEMTLTFVPKTIVIFMAIALMMPFMLETMVSFTHSLADRIVAIGLEE